MKEPTGTIDTIPHPAFWRETCRAVTKHACLLIQTAGFAVTPAEIVRFVASAPRYHEQLTFDYWRRDRCSSVMERAFKKSRWTEEERRIDEAIAFFIEHLPSLRWETAGMLIETVIGVMGALDLSPVPQPGNRSLRARWHRFINMGVLSCLSQSHRNQPSRKT